MMVTNQHLPFLLRAAYTARDQFAAGLKAIPRSCSTKYVGARVDRIGQQPTDSIVARQPPFHHASARTVDDDRHLDPFMAQPHGDLPDAAKFYELAECQVDRATQGRELSSLAPLRAFRARTPVSAWARRAVGEGVRSCPRAGCGRSTSRGSMRGM